MAKETIKEGRQPGLKYGSAKTRRAVAHPDSVNFGDLVSKRIQERAAGLGLEKAFQADITTGVKRVIASAKGKQTRGLVLELSGKAAEDATQAGMEATLDRIALTLNIQTKQEDDNA